MFYKTLLAVFLHLLPFLTCATVILPSISAQNTASDEKFNLEGFSNGALARMEPCLPVRAAFNKVYEEELAPRDNQIKAKRAVANVITRPSEEGIIDTPTGNIWYSYANDTMGIKGTIASFGMELYGANKQEILAQMFTLHPELEDHLAIKSKAIEDSFTANMTAGIEERKLISGAPLCIPVAGQPWVLTTTKEIYAVAAVISAHGDSYCREPPTNNVRCGVIACGNNARIAFCNDRSVRTCVLASYLSTMAKYISINCQRDIRWSHDIFSGGQAFDDNGFNVVASGGACFLSPSATKRGETLDGPPTIRKHLSSNNQLVHTSNLGESATSNQVTTRESSYTPNVLAELADGTMNFLGNVGGVDFNLNGTDLTHIFRQIYTAHPHLQNMTSFGAVESLETRAADYTLDPLCIPVNGQPWQITDYRASEIAITSIYNLGPQAVIMIQAGPRHCFRLVCVEKTAVWFCNDNGYPISPNARYLSSYIEIINKKCARTTGFGSVTGGQEFDTDNYNIIVRDDSTCPKS